MLEIFRKCDVKTKQIAVSYAMAWHKDNQTDNKLDTFYHPFMGNPHVSIYIYKKKKKKPQKTALTSQLVMLKLCLISRLLLYCVHI